MKTAIRTIARTLPLLIWIVVGAGCASIDFDYARTESSTLVNTSDTFLAEQFADVVAMHPPDESGFYPIYDGIDALAARLLLAEYAERSIDVQYYLIKDDLVGRAFINALLKAADRGVRVRLLLDDIFTSGYDAGMAALHAHPNFEIRIFNPFNRGGLGAAVSAVTNFSRINRRMHNKSFTIDNQATIIGGRNIADEYFGARKDVNFGDLDVLTIGSAVNDVSSMFDLYWNHEASLPVPAFINAKHDTDADLQKLRDKLSKSDAEVAASRYGEVVSARAYDYLYSDNSVFTWAPYQLIYDTPDKGIKGRAAAEDLVKTRIRGELLSAEKEILVISPYFVPMKSAIQAYVDTQQRGIDVTIVTNSLAANNQSTVHGGYAPSRKPLLAGGVKIYEIRADAKVAGSQIVAASGSTATLHTKAFAVDRKDLFIGSFNFDPRSADLNSEMGVIIKHPGMAEEFVEHAEQKLPEAAYEVFLDEDGKLRWRGLENGETVVLKKEPQTSWGKRFMAGLMRFLPIKNQL
jgi:putative cardiolipin synthase